MGHEACQSNRSAQGPVAAVLLPGDAVHGDVGDVARGRIIHGRKLDLGPEVDMSQGLKQLCGAALGDAGPAVDDDVLV